MEVFEINTTYKVLHNLIELCDKEESNYWIFVVIDSPKMASKSKNSGFLYPKELGDLVYGFFNAATKVKIFSSTQDFLAFLHSPAFAEIKDEPSLLYATTQLGTDILRRSKLPVLTQFFASDNHSLMGSPYLLELLQDKAKYFPIFASLTNIPKTRIFSHNSFFGDLTFGHDHVILKPSLESSTKGVCKIENDEDLIYDTASDLAQKFQQDIVIQDCLVGDEIMVPVVSDGETYTALEPVQVKFPGDILNEKIEYNEQYKIAPYRASTTTLQNIKDTASHLATFMHSVGISRYDFIVDSTGTPYLIDVAALPVLSHTSSVWQSFAASGFEPIDLFKVLIGTAIH